MIGGYGIGMLAAALGWRTPGAWGRAKTAPMDGGRPEVTKDRYKRKSHRRRLKRERDRAAIVKGVAEMRKARRIARGVVRYWKPFEPVLFRVRRTNTD